MVLMRKQNTCYMKTKFNVGDSAYIIFAGRIEEVKILKISIKIGKRTSVKYKILYLKDVKRWVAAADLFIDKINVVTNLLKQIS